MRCIVLTALHTGMRKNEIVTLRWEQLYLEERFVLLTDTKNGEARPVPLTSTITALFKEIQTEQQHTPSPFVFVNPHRKSVSQRC